MTRRFTDRDGVVWRVEWRPGQIAMGIRPEIDVDKVPLPPGGLHFRSDTDGFAVPMSEIDPNDLTEPELQAMVDDAGGDAPGQSNS